MSKPDFAKLRNILIEIARQAIMDFAKSKHNRDVYAFVFDTNEEYGSVIVSINTVSEFASTCDEYRESDPADIDARIGGLQGIKYNSGDFSFVDLGPESSDMSDWSEIFSEYLYRLENDADYSIMIELFSDTVAKAIGDLEPDFKQLDQTEDFIAYHCFHDSSNELAEALIRKTVDERLFARLFPDALQYRNFLEELKESPPNKAADIWLSILESYASGTHSPLSNEFYRRRYLDDVKPELVAIGEIALPQIFSLLEQIIHQPQFNKEGSDEWNTSGAFTRYNSVAAELIWAIEEIGICDADVESNLLSFIRSLHDLSEVEADPIGTNLSLTARALSTLMSDKYPSPLIDEKTNRLLNIASFLPSSAVN